MKRLPNGGRIDRSQVLKFRWKNQPLTGYRGDTIASALLAAGVAVTGHSLHRKRPRGTVSHGWDEPNSLVSIRGTCARSLAWATTTELVDGMDVSPWSGRTDLSSPDARKYVVRQRHTDLLVVGGGEAGRVAATAAVTAGRSVLLIDDDFRDQTLDRALASDYLHRTRAVFTEADGLVAALDCGRDVNTLWRIRAAEVLTATGATERPLIFPGNDLPAVMLARSVAVYLHRYAVLPGDRVVIATADATGADLARDLAAAGAHVTLMLGPGLTSQDSLESSGINQLPGRLVEARGVDRVSSAVVRGYSGLEQTLECNLIAVSGGSDARDHLQIRPDGKTKLQLGKSIPPVRCLHRQHACTCFVDQHRDVTTADLNVGVAVGLRSIQHMKRFTTLGTGADQGRLAAVPAAQVLSELLDGTPEEVGTSGRRPPSSPVPLGALAGARSKATSRPVRRGPLLDEWRALGWKLQVEGSWMVGARGGNPTGVPPDAWITELTGLETCIVRGRCTHELFDGLTGLLIDNRLSLGIGQHDAVEALVDISNIDGHPAVIGHTLQQMSLCEWVTERLSDIALPSPYIVTDISDGFVTFLHHGAEVPTHMIESTWSSAIDPVGTRRILVRRSRAVALWQYLLTAGCTPLGYDEYRAVRARAGLPSGGRETTAGTAPSLRNQLQLTGFDTCTGPVTGALVLDSKDHIVGHVTSVAHGNSALAWVGMASFDAGVHLRDTVVVLHDGHRFDARLHTKEQACTS